MPLPTEKTKPQNDPGKLVVGIHGPSGIGKTTFAAGADETYFLATEPGTSQVEVYADRIGSWEELLNKLAELAAGGHKFRTVAIDTVDNAYKMCLDYICRKQNITHPADYDFGKGWQMVNNEFQRVLVKLSALGYGVILVGHSKDKEVKSRTGKWSKAVFALSDSAAEVVYQLCDIVLYADSQEETDPTTGVVTGEHRVLYTKPTRMWDAKDRTGLLPEVLILPNTNTPGPSYAVFDAAVRKAMADRAAGKAPVTPSLEPPAPPAPPAPNSEPKRGAARRASR